MAALLRALTGVVIGLNEVGLFSEDGQHASTQLNPPPRAPTADAVAGTWSGSVRQGRGNVFEVQLNVAKGCEINESCGSISVSHLPCFGDLSLVAVSGERYEFSVDHFSSASDEACSPGAGEYLTRYGDDALLYTTGYDDSIRGILKPPR